ncbi:hypothetical protein PCANC_25745 [Puccinia coronata f. sp. avenae]|uniref:Uncharacterized protein n=1 Tax=Puccinia coronata f. sp. avenae TaxID=200324 RepID=A0A2N5RXV7_9BASI|nr:hypothetical protein PCANC_25745 [Puccinia coronata f. sp. avenae]
MRTIRQHIKHWLSTAKTVCNNSLKPIIFEITTYVAKEALNLREQDRIQHKLAGLGLRGHPGDTLGLVVSFCRTHARSGLCATQVPASGSLTSQQSPFDPHRFPTLSRRESIPPPTLDFCQSVRFVRIVICPRTHIAQSTGIMTRTRLSPIRVNLGVSAATLGSLSAVLRPPPRRDQLHVDLALEASSRSPLPRPIGPASGGGGGGSHRRSSPRADSTLFNLHGSSSYLVPSDEKFHDSPFVAALQENSSIATEILDTPAGLLAPKSHAHVDVIHRVQLNGKSWDEQDDWPHRGWYVRVLLAVAGSTQAQRVRRRIWGGANSSIDVIGTPHLSVDGETQGISTPQTTTMSGMRRRVFMGQNFWTHDVSFKTSLAQNANALLRINVALLRNAAGLMNELLKANKIPTWLASSLLVVEAIADYAQDKPVSDVELSRSTADELDENDKDNDDNDKDVNNPIPASVAFFRLAGPDK